MEPDATVTVLRFPLHTPRLLVRPMQVADAEELLDLYGDAEAMRHLTDEPPTSLTEARHWVQAKVDLYTADDQLSMWTVQELDGLRVVGDVGLQREDYGQGTEVGLGVRILRSCWGRGYGGEAAGAALEAGFGQLGLDRIGAETAVGNTATHRLLERLGMTHDGTTAEGWRVYHLDRADWAARR